MRVASSLKALSSTLSDGVLALASASTTDFPGPVRDGAYSAPKNNAATRPVTPRPKPRPSPFCVLLRASNMTVRSGSALISRLSVERKILQTGYSGFDNARPRRISVNAFDQIRPPVDDGALVHITLVRDFACVDGWRFGHDKEPLDAP